MWVDVNPKTPTLRSKSRSCTFQLMFVAHSNKDLDQPRVEPSLFSLSSVMVMLVS